jgi:hypothetical protein
MESIRQTSKHPSIWCCFYGCNVLCSWLHTTTHLGFFDLGLTTWLVAKAKCKWQAKLQNPRWIVVLYILTSNLLCDASIGSYVLVMIWLIYVGGALRGPSAGAQ